MSSIPTTGRTPDFLARQFGYDSVHDMSKKLKRNCTVFDVGAGTSLLGHSITALRKDIKWVNIDPCYKDPEYRKFLEEKGQSVELVTADISYTSNDLAVSNRKADYIFSYWLLPHLSTDTDDPAIKLVGGMYKLLAEDGVIIVGPIRKLGFGLLSPWRYRSSITYSQSDNLGNITDGTLKATRLWWLPRIVQGTSNKYNIHLAKRFVGAIKR